MLAFVLHVVRDPALSRPAGVGVRRGSLGIGRFLHRRRRNERVHVREPGIAVRVEAHTLLLREAQHDGRAPLLFTGSWGHGPISVRRLVVGRRGDQMVQVGRNFVVMLTVSDDVRFLYVMVLELGREEGGCQVSAKMWGWRLSFIMFRQGEIGAAGKEAYRNCGRL